MTMKALRKKVDKRVWHENENKTLFVFLVDKPIALGHSQLVMSISTDTHEEEVFKRAAEHIAVCIGRFRSIFKSLKRRQWGPLAQYTGTSGAYVKTLILRASAEEDPREYKVHLIPCFSSHIESANDLFRARFGKNESGGLLYWIGQREHLVDYDKSSADEVMGKKRIESFCLTGLAEVLRCPKQTARTAKRPGQADPL